jgi:hypothetical protein
LGELFVHLLFGLLGEGGSGERRKQHADRQQTMTGETTHRERSLILMMDCVKGIRMIRRGL